jgi:hypothetical protein
MRDIRSLPVTLAVAVLLAGCGSAAAKVPGPGGIQAEGSSAAGDCLLGANGADVEVGIASPTQSCGRWITNLAGTGLVWGYISAMMPPGQPGTADQETMAVACDLTDGTQELYVEDAGGMDAGNSICSQEEQNGWTPETSPGPLALQMAAQGQQAAQAQASASAAASQQQAVDQAQQQLSNDIGTLQSDAQSLDTDTTLAGDISTMKSDYQTEQQDWATEQSDYQQGGCSQESGDAETVAGDAQSVAGDQQSLDGDEQTIQASISGVRSDIAAVNNDVAALGGSGASPAQGPASALSAGRTAIRDASAAIAWATGQGNAIVAEANSLATTAQNYESQHGC